ncbi:MAG: Sulfotransferase family [Halomonas sp. HL-93]|nr:MAG: Sulfotransferase family [Halomonas sp. HL-93]
MIICEKHKFVFIHIPKCAGTSIRGILEPFDSRAGKYKGRVDHHPELGDLDYVHIPLFTLRDHFRPEFETVKQYWSFAVMRDPHARFASSVSQNLNKYSEKPIQKRSLQDIDLCIREIIDFLSDNGMGQILLPPEYIHFQRQVDFIELEGERVVTSLYAINQVDKLLLDVSRHTGNRLSDFAPDGTMTTANQSKVFRSDLLRRLIESSRPATEKVRNILPEDFKQKIRDQVYVPRDQRMRELFAADHIRAFIRDYYAEDIRLYNGMRGDNRSSLL